MADREENYNEILGVKELSYYNFPSIGLPITYDQDGKRRFNFDSHLKITVSV